MREICHSKVRPPPSSRPPRKNRTLEKGNRCIICDVGLSDYRITAKIECPFVMKEGRIIRNGPLFTRKRRTTEPAKFGIPARLAVVGSTALKLDFDKEKIPLGWTSRAGLRRLIF